MTTPSMSAPFGATRRQQAHAVTASFLGWTIDAFDFFVVVFLVDKLAVAFGVSKADILWTITATLAMRPVGAVLFGLLADRYGRRVPLMADVLFFSIIELACGFAPNYATFLVLRALYGIGMGGEWGVGASLAMEVAPGRLRGVLSGILQSGYSVGYLLAAVAARFILPLSPVWGWRAMFWVGGIPALLAFYIRSKVPESEAWKQHRAPTTMKVLQAIAGRRWRILMLSAAPMVLWIFGLLRPGTVKAIVPLSLVITMGVILAVIFFMLGASSGRLAYFAVLMTFFMFLSHGTQDLYPDFLKSEHHIASSWVSYIAILYNIGAIAGAIVFGHLSELVGRRRGILAALVLSLVMIPLWSFGGTIFSLALGAFLLQAGVQGAWGVVPAHLNELSPDAARGLVPGFAYQLGILFAAPTANIQYALRDLLGYRWALAGFQIAVIVLLGITVALGSEQRGKSFVADARSAAG